MESKILKDTKEKYIEFMQSVDCSHKVLDDFYKLEQKEQEKKPLIETKEFKKASDNQYRVHGEFLELRKSLSSEEKEQFEIFWLDCFKKYHG